MQAGARNATKDVNQLPELAHRFDARRKYDMTMDNFVNGWFELRVHANVCVECVQWNNNDSVSLFVLM